MTAMLSPPDRPGPAPARPPAPRAEAPPVLPLRATPGLDAARRRLAKGPAPSVDERRALGAVFGAAGPRGDFVLARLLRAPDAAVRRNALAVASACPGPGVSDALAGLLDDEALAAPAARLLGRNAAEAAVPALAAALDGPARTEAREALVAIGGARAARRLDAEADRRPGEASYDALARVSPERAATRCATAAGDAERGAWLAVVRDRPGRLRPALRALLSDRRGARAAGAARILGELRDEQAVPALRRLAARHEARAEAVAALVAVGTPDALEHAFSACARAENADAFAGARHAEAFLLQRARTGTTARRRLALALLARCGGPDTLETIASRPWPGGLVRAAIRTAGAVGGARAVEVLRRWRHDAGVRYELVDALGAAGHPDAVPLLVALADAGREARVAAALGRIPHRSSADALLGLLARGHDRNAGAALARLPAPVVVPVLLEALEQGTPARGARGVLRDLAGRDFGRRPERWRAWWNARS